MALKGDIDIRQRIIDVEPCVTRYSIHLPADCELVNIISVVLVNTGCCDSKGLNYYPHKPFSRQNFMWEKVVWYDDVDKVLHCERFNSPSQIKLHVSVCPIDNACELPAIYKTDYFDLLLTGAKSFILKIFNKPWTNLQLAMVYHNQFLLGINELSAQSKLHKFKGVFKMQTGKII